MAGAVVETAAEKSQQVRQLHNPQEADNQTHL